MAGDELNLTQQPSQNDLNLLNIRQEISDIVDAINFIMKERFEHHEGLVTVLESLESSLACEDVTALEKLRDDARVAIANPLIVRNIENYFNKVDTPLNRALWLNECPIAKTLILAGADIESVDTFLNTPLFYAAKKGYVEILALLIQKGVDLTALDHSSQKTALYTACYYGNIESLKLLVQKSPIEVLTADCLEEDSVYDYLQNNEIAEDSVYYYLRNNVIIEIKALIDIYEKRLETEVQAKTTVHAGAAKVISTVLNFFDMKNNDNHGKVNVLSQQPVLQHQTHEDVSNTAHQLIDQKRYSGDDRHLASIITAISLIALLVSGVIYALAPMTKVISTVVAVVGMGGAGVGFVGGAIALMYTIYQKPKHDQTLMIQAAMSTPILQNNQANDKNSESSLLLTSRQSQNFTGSGIKDSKTENKSAIKNNSNLVVPT